MMQNVEVQTLEGWKDGQAVLVIASYKHLLDMSNIYFCGVLKRYVVYGVHFWNLEVLDGNWGADIYSSLMVVNKCGVVILYFSN